MTSAVDIFPDYSLPVICACLSAFLLFLVAFAVFLKFHFPVCVFIIFLCLCLFLHLFKIALCSIVHSKLLLSSSYLMCQLILSVFYNIIWIDYFSHYSFLSSGSVYFSLVY